MRRILYRVLCRMQEMESNRLSIIRRSAVSLCAGIVLAIFIAQLGYLHYSMQQSRLGVCRMLVMDSRTCCLAVEFRTQCVDAIRVTSSAGKTETMRGILQAFDASTRDVPMWWGHSGAEAEGEAVLAAGWPFRCLTTCRTLEQDRWSVSGAAGKPEVAAIDPAWLPRSPIASAASIPGLTWVPVAPWWPGLLANSSILAVMIMILHGMCLSVRHRVRRWRQQCCYCSYPLTGCSVVCPECGTPSC